MKTSHSTIERLEARIAPAGLIAVSVSTAGTLLLKTVAGQDGDEVVTITQLASGAYQLTPGAGVALRFGSVDFSVATTVEGVTGGLVAKLGAGNDQVVLDGTGFTKPVVIDLGEGNNALTVQNCGLGGKLDFTALGGNDTVTFAGIAVVVAGAVNLRLGAGNDTVLVSATSRASFGAGFIIDAGLGDDGVTLGATNSTVDVLGAFQFLGGAGLNTLTAGAAGTGRVSVLGAALITGGGDADTITLAGARFTAGALTATLGAGDNSLISNATDFFIGGSLKWSGGAGIDHLELNGATAQIAGNVLVLNGDGASLTHFDPSDFASIGGSLTVLGGKAATGQFDFDFSPTVLNINGIVKVKNGDGASALTLSGGSSTHLGKGGSFSYGVGAGNATIGSNGALISNGPISMVKKGAAGIMTVFGGSGGDSVIAGAVTIKGGSQVKVILAGTITGALNMATAPGGNGSLIVQSNGAKLIHVGGAINLTASGGAANTTTFQLQGLVAEGAVSIRGGLEADTFNVDNNAFFKSLRVDFGAGADTFRLEAQGIAGGSIYFGPVTFLGGLDADTFLIGGNTAATQAVDFRALTTLDGGDGADVLTIGTQATFAAGSPVQKNIP